MSFALETVVILLLGTWVATLMLPPFMWLVAVALTVDLLARFGSSLRDEVLDPYRLFEWGFHRFDVDGNAISRL